MKYYKIPYIAADLQIQSLYNSYKSHHERIQESRKYADREIDKAWSEKIKFEEKLLRKYDSIRKRTHAKAAQSLRSGMFRKSVANDIMSNYYFLAGCSSQHCYENSIKMLKRYNEAFKKGNDLQRAKGLKAYDYDYTVEKNCSLSMDKGRNKFINKNLPEHEDYNIDRKSSFNKFSKYNTIKCSVDFRPVQSLIIDRMYERLTESTYIVDFSARNKAEFAKSQASSDSISYAIFEQSGVKMPKNWNRNNKEAFYEAFYEAFKQNKLGDQYGILKEKLKEKFGFDVPLNLTKKQFYSLPKMRELIKDIAGVFYIDDYEAKGYNNFEIQKWKTLYREKMYNGFKMEMQLDENFKEHFKNHLGSSLASYFIEEKNKNNEYVDKIFKATVVPIIAILFSLFFGIINFAFILKDIVCFILKVVDRKKQMFVGAVLSALLLTSPLLIGNSYTDSDYFNEVIYPSMSSDSKVGAIVYKWFLNTEIIVYSTTGLYFVEPKFFVSDNESMLSN